MRAGSLARELARRGLAVSSTDRFRADVPWVRQCAGHLDLDEGAVAAATADLADAERIFREIGTPFEKARVSWTPRSSRSAQATGLPPSVT